MYISKILFLGSIQAWPNPLQPRVLRLWTRLLHHRLWSLQLGLPALKSMMDLTRTILLMETNSKAIVSFCLEREIDITISRSAYTSSLTSSIKNHTFEKGRRYASYQPKDSNTGMLSQTSRISAACLHTYLIALSRLPSTQ